MYCLLPQWVDVACHHDLLQAQTVNRTDPPVKPWMTSQVCISSWIINLSKVNKEDKIYLNLSKILICQMDKLNNKIDMLQVNIFRILYLSNCLYYSNWWGRVWAKLVVWPQSHREVNGATWLPGLHTTGIRRSFGRDRERKIYGTIPSLHDQFQLLCVQKVMPQFWMD